MSNTNEENMLLADMLLHRAIEKLYFHEASLLDARNYDAWLELLTDDFKYFVPLMRNIEHGQDEKEVLDGPLDTAWFDERKETIKKRVMQLQTGYHWAEEPTSRISHLITNLEILEAVPGAADATKVTAKSRFLVYRNRGDMETDILVGKREDVLVHDEGAWKVSSRKVLLDQNVLMAKNLTMFF